jgi:ribosomal protein S18 acetylase RimI-like enzyme
MIADVAIRFATAADAEPIARMSRDLIETGLPWSWTPGRVRRSIADGNTNVVVVDAPDGLAAFGIMFHADDDAHLLLLAVAAGRQRSGVGSAVLHWLEAAARTAGARRIRVEARRDNDAARHFYSEHGYHERVIRPGMYSGVVAGLRLEKWLRSDKDTADAAALIAHGKQALLMTSHVRTQPWPQIVAAYQDRLEREGGAWQPMLDLVRFLAAPRYASSLFPAMSDDVLRIGHVRDFRFGEDEVQVAFDPATRQFRFTHLRGPDEGHAWLRDCEADGWEPVLHRLLHKRLQWFHEG